MSDSVREAFERTHTCPSRRTLTAWEGFQEGHQAATAAADAEWRGVVEKLVEALEYVEANYDGMNKAAIVRQALAQAEKFMGRK